MNELSHIGPDGRARMVDIGAKPVTERVAVAQGKVSMAAATRELAMNRETRKGDPIAIAELAGGRIGIGSLALGVATAAMDIARQYVSEREQFDRKIGSFQTIKHRLADMMVLVESSRSSVYYAACIASEQTEETDEVISIAKSYCSESYFKCAADAIQLHGGVGFTWEFDVHLYFKRAKSSEISLGNPQIHKDKIANILGI